MAGGFWSAYWYNGAIYATELARGVDVLRLTPSEHLTRNELAAAVLVNDDVFNPQHQTKVVWPATPIVAQAYLDQLARGRVIPAARIDEIRNGLRRLDSLRSGRERNARTLMEELEGLAVRLQRESSTLSGRDQDRLAGIADVIQRRIAALR
jgi:hypothetical protein